MTQEVHAYVDACRTCNETKVINTHTPPKNIELPEQPWQHINYDFIVKLPLSLGFDSILVVVDRFTRQAHFIPCNESINAEELADVFIREVFKHHRPPEMAISDQGPSFNSNFLKTLYERLQIE